MIIFKLVLISWFITHFSPFQDRLEVWVGLLLLQTKKQWLITITDNVYIVLSCMKCTGLYLSLIVTLNPLYAILVSFLCYTYLELIKRTEI